MPFFQKWRWMGRSWGVAVLRAASSRLTKCGWGEERTFMGKKRLQNSHVNRSIKLAHFREKDWAYRLSHQDQSLHLIQIWEICIATSSCAQHSNIVHPVLSRDYHRQKKAWPSSGLSCSNYSLTLYHSSLSAAIQSWTKIADIFLTWPISGVLWRCSVIAATADDQTFSSVRQSCPSTAVSRSSVFGMSTSCSAL